MTITNMVNCTDQKHTQVMGCSDEEDKMVLNTPVHWFDRSIYGKNQTGRGKAKDLGFFTLLCIGFS